MTLTKSESDMISRCSSRSERQHANPSSVYGETRVACWNEAQAMIISETIGVVVVSVWMINHHGTGVSSGFLCACRASIPGFAGLKKLIMNRIEQFDGKTRSAWIGRTVIAGGRGIIDKPFKRDKQTEMRNVGYGLFQG